MISANFVHLENGPTKTVCLLMTTANVARQASIRLSKVVSLSLFATNTAPWGNGPTSLVSPLTPSANFVPSAGTRWRLEQLRIVFLVQVAHSTEDLATPSASLALSPQISPPTSAWWTSPVDLLSPSSVKFHEIRPACQAIRLM